MLEINKENVDQEVLASEKPVILDFWGPSCQPCLALMPDVEVLAEEYAADVKMVKVNSAENKRLCVDMRVMGLPSFLVYKDGEEMERISGGELKKEDIEQLIQRHRS